MISALIEDGQFTPEKYGLSVEDCETWSKLWRWCDQHQLETGEAPSPNLLKVKWPDFEFTRRVPVAYAAKQLATESESRKMKIALRASLQALHNDDIEGARAELAGITASRPLGKPGDDLWHLDENTAEDVKWPVPYDSLGRVTGGIGAGELWYLAAPSGHGKTMMLCHYMGPLLKTGLKIAYISCEVPAKTINKRVRRSMATKEELKLLDAKDGNKPDRDKIKQAIEMQRKRIDGSLTVYDPSHGRVTPGVVRHHMHHSDLVVVDHIGLMHTADGRRAIDDWRALATISNSLMEDKLATGTPILAAAQLNKDGMEGGMKPPKLTTVGGSYQLVMDADVLITMKQLSRRVLVHGSEKNREGDNATWFSKFDVAKSDYRQITYEQAMEQISTDEDEHHLR